MRALFWFSSTATLNISLIFKERCKKTYILRSGWPYGDQCENYLFSRHFIYSFFFLRHSRAASRFFRSRISRFLKSRVNIQQLWIEILINIISMIIITIMYTTLSLSSLTLPLVQTISNQLTGLICLTRRQGFLDPRSPTKTWRRGQRMGCGGKLHY